MKLVTFSTATQEARPGALVDGQVVDLAAADPAMPTSLREILAKNLVPRAREIAADPRAIRHAAYTLQAPVPDPKQIFCIGLNYRDHAVESGMAIPEEPIVFGKFSGSVAAHEEPIALPRESAEVDFEAELVAVIGRRASRVDERHALDYVAGYTIGNDVSARDWQLRKPGGQWMLGKSFTSFAPIGPTLTTADDVPDPHALAIELRLNGERMQRSSTSQLIFRIDRLIAYLSHVVALEPGDLLFTGTPPGVGFARKPPVFLKNGDVCEIEIAGLGTLRNRCVGG